MQRTTNTACRARRALRPADRRRRAEEGIQLKPQRSLLTLPPARDEPAPVFMEADTLRGHRRKGDRSRRQRASAPARPVVLRRLDALRDASSSSSKRKATCALEYGGDLLEGDHLRFNLGTERGFMEKPTFRMTPDSARLRAARTRRPVLAIAPCAIPAPAHRRAAAGPRRRRAAALPGAGPLPRRAGELHDLRPGQRRLVHPRARARHRQEPQRRRRARREPRLPRPDDLLYAVHLVPAAAAAQVGLPHAALRQLDVDRRRADGALLLEHRAQPRRDDLPAHHEQARLAARHASSAISTRTTTARRASSTCPTTARSATTATATSSSTRTRSRTAGAARST